MLCFKTSRFTDGVVNLVDFVDYYDDGTRLSRKRLSEERDVNVDVFTLSSEKWAWKRFYCLAIHPKKKKNMFSKSFLHVRAISKESTASVIKSIGHNHSIFDEESFDRNLD
jgi:hypothetical protein